MYVLHFYIGSIAEDYATGLMIEAEIGRSFPTGPRRSRSRCAGISAFCPICGRISPTASPGRKTEPLRVNGAADGTIPNFIKRIISFFIDFGAFVYYNNIR